MCPHGTFEMVSLPKEAPLKLLLPVQPSAWALPPPSWDQNTALSEALHLGALCLGQGGSGVLPWRGDSLTSPGADCLYSVSLAQTL
jgi:hypothetical protein